MPTRPTLALTRTIAAFVCLLTYGAAGLGGAAAQEFCSEPVAPYCVDKDSEFDSRVQINRCEDDLNDYEQQLNEYETCITQQLESMRSDLADGRKRLKEADKNF